MTPDNLKGIKANKDYLIALGEELGSWTVKADARQTGCSIYFTFENKVPVETTLKFISLIENAPGTLTNALRLLLGEEQVTE